jgi:hypothetical protein
LTSFAISTEREGSVEQVRLYVALQRERPLVQAVSANSVMMATSKGLISFASLRKSGQLTSSPDFLFAPPPGIDNVLHPRL